MVRKGCACSGPKYLAPALIVPKWNNIRAYAFALVCLRKPRYSAPCWHYITRIASNAYLAIELHKCNP